VSASTRGIIYVDVGWRRALDIDRGFPTDEPEISACWDIADRTDPEHPLGSELAFQTIEEAVAWARDRSPIVIVRLGPTEDQMYSAGERLVTRTLPEHGGTDLTPYPEWKPPR
jgi:hypothetical protein